MTRFSAMKKVLVLTALLAPTGHNALAHEDMGPDTFASIGATELAAGDELWLECDSWFGWDGTGTPPSGFNDFFVGGWARDAEGDESAFVVISSFGGDRIALQVGEIRFSLKVGDAYRSSGVGLGVGADSPIQVRLVVATWGGGVPCRATLNDSPFPFDLLPSSAGVLLDAEHYPGLFGIAAAKGVRGPFVYGGAGTSAGAGLSYEHQADGFFWTVLQGDGIATLSGPDGEAFGPRSFVGLGSVGESHGTWRYDTYAADSVAVFALQTPI